MNETSLKRLAGVHPDLRRVIETAALAYETENEIRKQTLTVSEGLRTIERQRQLFSAGKSQTLQSRHLTGHAVDLAVIIAGQAEWALQLYSELAGYVGASAAAHNVPVVWGGCWIRLNGQQDLDTEVSNYIQRKRRQGSRPFIDGPHFELDKEFYP